MDKNRIEKGLYWDEAWSLVSGCTPVSEGCQNCWSARETHMRAEHPNDKVRARNKGLTEARQFNGLVRLNYEFLEKPLQKKKPTVFAIWNDLFHEHVPFGFVDRVFAIMALTKQHTFLVLTKRPIRMRQYIDGLTLQRICEAAPLGLTDIQVADLRAYVRDNFPLPNVWLGVTAENQRRANERIPILLQIPAAVRFVSVEPMLGPVNLNFIGFDGVRPISAFGRCSYHTHLYKTECLCNSPRSVGIDWVICGGETGPGARPAKIAWIRDLKDQCQAAGVPFFLKQMEVDGKIVKMPELDGRTWDDMPEM